MKPAMPLRVWIKSRFADPALRPLRAEVMALVPKGACVIDIGCGTGDLLMRGAEHIGGGVGVDLDRAMVRFAQERAKVHPHIQFRQGSGLSAEGQFDIATASLCLHAMAFENARNLLAHMLTLAPTVLIADFIQPPRFVDKLALELDELISGHYLNFYHYRRLGGIESLAKMVNAQIISRHSSSLSCVAIWRLQASC